MLPTDLKKGWQTLWDQLISVESISKSIIFVIFDLVLHMIEGCVILYCFDSIIIAYLIGSFKLLFLDKYRNCAAW